MYSIIAAVGRLSGVVPMYNCLFRRPPIIMVESALHPLFARLYLALFRAVWKPEKANVNAYMYLW